MIKGKGRKVSKLIKGSKELSQGRHEGIFCEAQARVRQGLARDGPLGERP